MINITSDFNNIFKPSRTIFWGVLLLMLSAFGSIDAKNITITTSTNWSQVTTGSGSKKRSPNATDAITVRNGATLTVDVTDAICGSITLGGNSWIYDYSGTLQFASSGSPSLTVSGSVLVGGTYVDYWGNTSDGTIILASGASMTAGSLVIGNASSDASGTVDMSSGGTLTLKGAITLSGNGTKTWTPGSGTVAFTVDNTLPSSVVTSFNNLTISGGTTTLGSATTVNGTLTLSNGLLKLGTNDLTLGTSSPAVSGNLNSNNMIVADGTGSLRKTFSTTSNSSYLFPIGDASGTYSPITLNFTSLTNPNGYAGVRVTNAKHPKNASVTNYLNRYWTVSSSGITGFSCNVTGSYVTNDIVGSEANQVAGLYSGSLPWTKYSTLGSNTLTATGVTSFGDFTGITAASSTVSINANPGLSVGLNSTLTLTANPVGDPTFTYLWSPGGATTQSVNPSTSTVGSTDYTCTVTDGNGFTATKTVTVYVTPPIEVTATSGTTNATYPSLKAAFDNINNGTHQGSVVVKVKCSTMETASAVLNASGTGSASYTKADIYPVSPNVSITGNIKGPLVKLNGADNVTINGSVYEINGSPSLTLSNTSTDATASTLTFAESAQNNSIKYCNIRGARTSANLGVVTFSTATAGTGNDNDTISYCNISGLDSTLTNRPVNAIYSAGSSSTIDNSGDVIANNNIYNFFNPAVASNGINIGANSNAFTISGNSFYGTTTFIPTSSVEYDVIRINNPSGGGFTISNNYIGGNGASCSGTWTKTNAGDNTFKGIYLNTGTTASSIQGNVISGFAYSNAANASWTGIYVDGGVANIGTATGNTIGANTGTGAVTITESTDGGNVYGIYIPGTSAVDCENNTVGSITTAIGSALSANFYGIYKEAVAGTTTISNNIVGSNTTQNSINTSSAATSSAQSLYGIYSAGTDNTTITGNTVANLTNSTTSTSISPTRGIYTIAGTNTIKDNTVHDITTYNAQSNNYENSTLIGIGQISQTASTTQNVSGNSVYNLKNTTAATIEMYGIYYKGPDTGVNTNVISRNFIRSFIIVSTDAAYLHGLSLYDGDYTASNNIVFLGDNITTGCHMWGIWNNSNKSVKIYHNTVYLNGVATTGTSNSFAYRDLSSAPTARDVRNNIFWNGRINTTTISHYAIYLQSTSNTTLDYNDYQFAQNFGSLGSTSYATLADWKSGTGLDPNSISIDPKLTNLGGSLPSDYQPGIGTLSGTSGTGITTDYGYLTRSITVPTMGAWEYFGNPVEVWKNNAFQQSYPNLKGAFDAINAAVWTGDLTVKIKGNTSETASAVLYQSGYTSGSTTSSYSHVLIYPTRNLIQVKGKLTAPLVDLNGADNVTFDGRLNGTGAGSQLMLINDSVNTASSTIRFINSAENNTIQYCTIQGANTAAAGGIIHFATASSGNGNSGNKISYNSITSTSPAKRVANAIYSAGTASHANSKDSIVGNAIYDFLNPSFDSYGVNISSNSTDFAIIGNSFYETTTLTPTVATTCKAISIDNTSGNNFTLSGNYIGGQAALCQGSPLSVGTTSISLAMNPIYVNAGTTATSSVWGNTIQNISLQSSSASPFSAINVNAGKVRVSGNTIGSSTGTGSLVLTAAATTAASYGIFLNSADSVNVSNDTIGSITVANSNSAYGHSLYGIYKTTTAGTLVVSGNVIGNPTSNNINASSTSSSYNQSVYGVYTLGTGGTTISANTIANILNSSTRNNVANSVYGISFGGSTTGKNTIDRNLIYGLSSSSAGTTNRLVGIGLNSGVVTVSNNIVSLGGGTSGLYTIYGIYDAGATASQINYISHNTVYMSGSISSGTTASTAAFYKASNTGTSNIRNNIFFNARSGGNTGEHYALYLPGTNQTINYNNYFVNGTNGVLGYLSGDKATLALWKSATGQDNNSLFVNPSFKNAGSAVATDYLIGTNLFGTAGTGITTDYGSYPRSSTSPSMGAWEWYNKWKGSTSIDWNTASNWTGGVVPSADDNIVFDDVPLLPCYLDQDRSVTDIVNAQSTYRMFANGKNLTIKGNLNFTNGAQIDATNNGSTVTFAGTSAQNIPSGAFYNDAVYNLTVNNANNVALNGNLRLLNILTTTSGLLDASTNSPTFYYAGSAAQTIENSQFLNNSVYNLIIDNASGVTLNTGLAVNNALTVNSGKLFTIAPAKGLTVSGPLTNNAGTTGLVLGSTAAGTASLVHNTDGVLATVNRFIPSDSTAWYFLSSPVATQPIFNTAWTPSGNHGDGTGYDLYVWDEPSSCWIYNLNDSTGTNITYTTWPQAHPESYFVPGRGYLYALMGADATQQFAGTLNNGTVSRDLTISASGSYKGFNLLGNPYPSSIDWTNNAGFDRSRLSLDGSGYDLWIWSQTANNYGVYNSSDADGTGTNNVTQYIAPMQGFFVLASAPGSITFNNGARVHNGASAWLRSAGISSGQDVRLSVASGNSAGMDEVKLGFGFDSDAAGALKIFSPVHTAPSLYLPVSGSNYTTCRMTSASDHPSVPVSFKAGLDGTYTLTCRYDASTMGPLYLEDRKTEILYDLSNDSTYTFQASTSDAAQRFVLHFGTLSPTKDEILANVWVKGGQLYVSLDGLDGAFNVQLSDITGSAVWQKTMAGGEQCSVSLPVRGVYVVTVKSGTKKRNIKVIY